MRSAEATPDPPYGERAVSWTTVWRDLYPEDGVDPHDDEAAAEIHRLRGLVAAQASETEEVLARILRSLDPETRINLSAGQLLGAVRKKLAGRGNPSHEQVLGTVNAAILRRNRVLHDAVTIGSVWREYATGGGEWQPVIAFLGDDESDEMQLRSDLSLQQEATGAAVRILRELATVEAAERPTEVAES